MTGLATRFVRKDAKAYGTCRLAEGGDVDGERLVVVEDVVTSGGQVVMSCADLRERGAEIVRVLCVIDREAGGAAALQAEGLELRGAVHDDGADRCSAGRSASRYSANRAFIALTIASAPMDTAASIGAANGMAGTSAMARRRTGASRS